MWKSRIDSRWDEHNVEAYLARCIDSILDQTYTEYEILLIDDGSTDGSGRICDDYCKRDSRIKTFHKPNGGVSSARNVGLSEASGEVVCFIDSDDFIHPQYLDIMYRAYVSSGADIVICDYVTTKDYPNLFHQIQRTPETAQIGYEDYLNCALSNHSNIYAKLYKTTTIRGHYFDENMVYGEDAVFNFSLIFSRDGLKMVRVDETLYYYYDRPGSAVNSMTKDVALAEVEWYLKHWDIFKKQYQWIVCEHAIKQLLHIRMELYKTPEYARVMERWTCLSRGLTDIIKTIESMPLPHRIKYYVALKYFGLYRFGLLLNDPTLIELEKKKRDE